MQQPKNSKSTYEKQAKNLAKSFHAKVRQELAPYLARIDKQNVQYQKNYGGGVCATHDFADANKIMAVAFEECFGRAVVIHDSRDIDLWNHAWDIAKKHGFSKEWEDPE